MEKGKAARVYHINVGKLREALDAIDETVKSLRDLLEEETCSQCGGDGWLPIAGTHAITQCNVCGGTGHKT